MIENDVIILKLRHHHKAGHLGNIIALLDSYDDEQDDDDDLRDDEKNVEYAFFSPDD